jgi:hypothetical protein
MRPVPSQPSADGLADPYFLTEFEFCQKILIENVVIHRRFWNE